MDSADRRGRKLDVIARGWSDESIDGARARALEIAGKIADLLSSGVRPSGKYAYGERPLPEPVLQEFRRPDGGLVAVVTRNVYGSLVLNADSLMFVDVDRKDVKRAGAGGLLGALFGKPKPQPAAPDPSVDAMTGVAQQHGISARVYQTAGGYRLLVTSAPFTPGSSDAESLLGEFGADPLYVRLCRSQQTFRARLTPKPWRCGCAEPPVQFPFETTESQARFDRWRGTYETKSAPYATCRYVTTIGPDATAAGFAELIEYHDAQTKAQSDLKLA